MKRFPKELVIAVEPALRAARDVLADLEADDVPASLRRVVAHSSPRLTPPLAAKLISELDALDWLRADAADRLADDATDAAKAFLARDDGWWVDVAGAVADARTRSTGGEVRSLTQQSSKQRAALDATKAKLRQHKVEAEAQIAALRDEVKLLRRRAESTERSDARDRAGHDRQILSFETELAASRAELAEAEQTLAQLRARVRTQRRDLADARRALESGGSSSVPRDPLMLARDLDLASASVPQRHGAEPVGDGDSIDTGDRLVLPAGVRPDRAEAVEWLLTQAAMTVIVDGYNLLFNLEPGEFTTGKARRRLGTLMTRFVRNSKATPTVVIVFDSTLPGDRDSKWAGQGVKVIFAEADRLADEEVVLLAASIAGPVVVVSSDREVQVDAARHGALVLWAEAFVEWLGSR